MNNCDEVFSRVSSELGDYLCRIPDGETGERSRWIFFQRQMLLDHPATEINPTVPALELKQWDGKPLRSLPLIRFREDVDLDEVDFIHVPVPQGRTEPEFYKPLRSLNESPDTRIFLGLILQGDPDGDQVRIAVAKQYLADFGVATECGWGRTDPKNIAGLLASHRQAAEWLNQYNNRPLGRAPTLHS